MLDYNLKYVKNIIMLSNYYTTTYKRIFYLQILK